MNGKPCYNQAAGYCHDGQCPTHEHHCWRLFGPGNPTELYFFINITLVTLNLAFLSILANENSDKERIKFPLAGFVLSKTSGVKGNAA